MADSAPAIADPEVQESLDVIDRKAQKLADQIRQSKHFIAFTGAGVSTSAGIPDFRGPNGAWTLRAQGRERTEKTTSTLQAIPTKTHMALVALQDKGWLKYLVSQNCDGLHRRSGILPEKISELHGNSNKEYCKDCGKEYMRDFRAVSTYEKGIHDHRTGRRCILCNGPLLDTIINFEEFLSEGILDLAYANAKKADFCLALGSSLSIPPANKIPTMVGQKKGAKLVICNLQETELDHLADLRIFGKTDQLMEKVMQKLGLEIPKFILHRRLAVELETKDETRHQLTVAGVDVDGTPVTYLKSVKLAEERRVARTEPFVMNFRNEMEIGTLLKLELEFMGHYGEPNLEIEVEYDGSQGKRLFLLEYNPQNGEWKTRMAVDRDRREDERPAMPDVSVIDLTGDDSS